MPRDFEGLADLVVLTVKNAMAPMRERLVLAEHSHVELQARVAVLTDLRDRLTTVETKAATVAEPMAPEPPVDLSPLLERVAVTEQRQNDLQMRLTELISLRDRLVTVETKAVEPRHPEPMAVDLGPLLERVAVAEAALTRLEAAQSTLTDLRDRIVTVETKSAFPVDAEPVDAVDLSPIFARLVSVEVRLAEVHKYAERIDGYASVLQRDAAALGERLAVVETRPSIPGPAGEPGPSGKDGLNGKDGMPGLSYEGVYQDGKSYDMGQLATWAGATWHCNESTTTKPGEGSKAWTLMVKRGRDGRDGLNGKDFMPVIKVGA